LDAIFFLLRYLHNIYDFAVHGKLVIIDKVKVIQARRFHSFSWTWTRMDIMDGMDTMDFPFDGRMDRFKDVTCCTCPFCP
jgi:hypothetical protein